MCCSGCVQTRGQFFPSHVHDSHSIIFTGEAAAANYTTASRFALSCRARKKDLSMSTTRLRTTVAMSAGQAFLLQKCLPRSTSRQAMSLPLVSVSSKEGNRLRERSWERRAGKRRRKRAGLWGLVKKGPRFSMLVSSSQTGAEQALVKNAQSFQTKLKPKEPEQQERVNPLWQKASGAIVCYCLLKLAMALEVQWPLTHSYVDEDQTTASYKTVQCQTSSFDAIGQLGQVQGYHGVFDLL